MSQETDEQKLAVLQRKYGLQPRQETMQERGIQPTTPLAQYDAKTQADREVLAALMDEFCQDEDWGNWLALLEQHGLHYFLILQFEGDEPFLNRWGENMIVIISPCVWEELVHFSVAPVPSTIVTKANLAALEVVEKRRGVLGTSICLAGGGSEFHVSQIRQGIPNPMPLVTEYEMEKADKLLDRGYFGERLMDKVIGVTRALWGEQQRDVDVNRLGANIAERIYKDKVRGMEGGKIKLPKWAGLLIGIATVGILLFTVYYLYFVR